MRNSAAPRERLARMLTARSVAVVGASPGQRRSDNAIRALIDLTPDVFLVSRTRKELYGRRGYGSLAEIGRPVDAVLSLVNADAAVGVVESAREVGAGGVVVLASGFAEIGGAGVDRQRRLVSAAGDMPVIGPNCLGFINVGVARASVSPLRDIRRGGICVISHSGALTRPLVEAAEERGLGFSLIASVGNEAVTDMADVIDFCVGDDNTKAICLVLETIRDPAKFMAAARRAMKAGKPLVALLLGRTARGRAVAASHTGALLGDTVAYEAALRSVGASAAPNLDELLDRVSFFEQAPRSRWSAVDGLSVLSSSGGAAGLVSDLCAQYDLPLPELTDLLDEVAGQIPGTTVANPLDLTGFVLDKPDIVRNVLARYLAHEQVDTAVQFFVLNEGDDTFGASYVTPFLEAASSTDKLMVMAGPVAMRPADWTSRIRDAGVCIGLGAASTVRGLAAMRAFVTARDAPPPPAGESAPAGAPSDRYLDAGQEYLRFRAAMDFVADTGLTPADYALVCPDGAVEYRSEFDDGFVAKLANVAHRSEHGAVVFGHGKLQLTAAVTRLREIAEGIGAEPDVVVQRRLPAVGELLIGARGVPGFGPLVALGLGGVLVEMANRYVVRLAPLSEADAADMVRAVLGPRPRTVRGRPVIDYDELVKDLIQFGGALLAGESWIESVDLNPVLLTPDGLVCVDCLVAVRPPSSANDPAQPRIDTARE